MASIPRAGGWFPNTIPEEAPRSLGLIRYALKIKFNRFAVSMASFLTVAHHHEKGLLCKPFPAPSLLGNHHFHLADVFIVQIVEKQIHIPCHLRFTPLN